MTEYSHEVPVRFPCLGDNLVGVLHRGHHPSPLGLIVVTGGPQYRTGSHRQFVLMARYLANRGIAVLRFDARGKGDSDGEFPGFESIGSDISAAIDALKSNVPTVREIALWGLCDAASAILLSAPFHHSITRIALINPWVRTDSGLARTYLRHYYRRRITESGLWRKMAAGELKFLAAGGAFFQSAFVAFGSVYRRIRFPRARNEEVSSLPERMATSLERFSGHVLLVLSGKDLTAKEFEDVVSGSRRWRKLLARDGVVKRVLPESDHTFSRRVWRDQLAKWTIEWLSAPITHLSRRPLGLP